MACFFGFEGHLGVFLTFGGRKAGAFFSFFVVTPPLRGGVGVLWFTSLLLNVSGHRRRLVRRTVERLVGSLSFLKFWFPYRAIKKNSNNF